MNSKGSQAVLAVLLLVMCTVKAENGDISFWRNNFKMICPEEGKWFKKGELIPEIEAKEYEVVYNASTKGIYHCEYENEYDEYDDSGNSVISKKIVKYYFYVQGRVCENCFELDANLLTVAIVVDMVGTVLMMMIIYRCTKKKSSPAPHSGKAPARSGGRAPPVPSPDYEQLNPHSRSQDPYSFLNRMG
ncbi:hypothetical protein PAMP_018906 [Pampus punctatissimus]